MLLRVPALLRWTTLIILTLALLTVGRDSLRLNPAQQAALGSRFDLVQWELTNFFSKWVHRLASSLPWNSRSEAERRILVLQYFALGEEFSHLLGQLREASAQSATEDDTAVARLEDRLNEVRSARGRLRNDAEEAVEAAISAVVSRAGLGNLGDFIFPPVDMRLSEPPKLLLTSPRDRIARTHEVLLEPGISVRERNELESGLMDGSDLSAIVIDIGGVATYPASLPNDQPLRWTLQTSAHEWLHHLFAFRALGQNISSSPEMQTLNETMAEIAGREIGDEALQLLADDPAPREDPPMREADVEFEDTGAFDFEREMRETRLRVDELLAEGKIEAAEAYMERRRRLFVDNGFHIRKLNQAYFAFHGTYAESPTSVSPIGDQLHRLRQLVPDLGAFVKAVAGVSTYQQFLDKLSALEAESHTGRRGQNPTPMHARGQAGQNVVR